MKFANLEEPQVFVEAAMRGSFTAAAHILRITPAAASAAIRKLEKRLGVRLFERTTRHIRLTQEGETLLGYCEQALNLLREGGRVVSDERASLRGLVRITVPSDLARNFLLPLFDEWLETHPAFEILLMVGDPVVDIMQNQVDVALRYGSPGDSRLVARPLASVSRIAVAAPAYLARRGVPTHPSELVQHECLCFAGQTTRPKNWRFWPIDAKSGVAPLMVQVKGQRSADDASIIRQWAIAAHGIAYKSELDLAGALRTGQLVRLFSGWRGEPMPFNALLPSNRFIPARVRALLDFLQARMGDERASSWPERSSSDADPFAEPRQ